MGICDLCRRDDLIERCIRLCVADVVGNGALEQEDFLRNDGDVAPQGLGGDLLHIDPVDLDGTADDLVEAVNQIGDGALSGAI